MFSSLETLSQPLDFALNALSLLKRWKEGAWEGTKPDKR